MTDEDTQSPDWYAELAVGGRRWPWWGWIPVVLVFAAVLGWWLVHPTPLPERDDEVTVAIKAGQTAYVGVLAQSDADDERDIEIRDVSFETSADGLHLKALICRGGTGEISSTTQLEPFCDEVVDAEGSFQVGGSDQLVVAVEADQAVSATVEEINVSYRQGIQFGTQPTGPSIAVQIVD